MKITDSNKIGGLGSIKKKKGADSVSGDFDALLNDGGAVEETNAAATSGVGPINMLDSLFAVQQIENNYQRSEEAINHGKQVLDFLDELRHGLLNGKLDRQQIQKLKDSVNTERGWVMDQKLIQILDDIETRAEVELAKLEMSKKLQ